MISFFVGVPGSGKTYFAVDKIYNNFSADKEAKKDKKITYDICYTNINEFKFDKVENVYELDFEDLKIKLTELHKYYKDKKDDEFLIERCKEYKIYNALFVVDEAHNYFDVKDVILVWWLSYHRHLFHEIILITQNLSLIESKYKSFSEFFYKAFPQSLTLFKTHFKYNVYCSSRMSMNSKSGSIKVKRNKKVFALYRSGDSINSQNIILKFIIFSFFLFIALLIFFKFFILDKNSDNKNTSEPVEKKEVDFRQINVLPSEAISEISNYKNKKFFSLICTASICFNDDVSIPVELLTYFIKEKNITLLFSQKNNNNNYKFYLDSSNDFYRFISKKELKNEKISSGSSSIIPVFGSK